MRVLIAVLFAASLTAAKARTLHVIDPRVYSGMCDASAAVAVSSNLFVVVSDEDNILRFYRTDKSGGPVKQFDLAPFLNFHDKSQETDLECAARIGDRAFWMGSHGRSKSGKLRLTRRCLFATDIKTVGGEITLVPIGKPFLGLLQGLFADSRFSQFHLEAAAQLAPKKKGALNIEGISATPEGHLLIGFRNPIPDDKALLIPLLNPNEVVEGSAPQFGDPILLDLGGLGIRDIAWHDGTYLIIGGPYDASPGFHLYRWKGPGSVPEQLNVDGLDPYNPEGLVIYPQYGIERFQVLSDDGTRMVDGCQCKDLKNSSKQIFRSFWVAP